jgi:pimeloyl-ACP methyl ester carboxylesterase
VVISGSGDGNMADNLEIVNSFLSAGYNVATYDYRGYGASSDFKIDPDLYIYPQFITDLNAVLDHLRKSRAITKFDLIWIEHWRRIVNRSWGESPGNQKNHSRRSLDQS